MQHPKKSSPSLPLTVQNISKAIFIVNKHAKTAPDPKFLYTLKKQAIEKLVSEHKAIKKGLHFSRNPKNSRQQSDLLISVGEYFFHMPPSKEDFKSLPHLGSLNDQYRNPKTRMSLSHAKSILQAYTGYKPPVDKNIRNNRNRKYEKPVFKKLGQSY
jgi:hypothetical protein